MSIFGSLGAGGGLSGANQSNGEIAVSIDLFL